MSTSKNILILGGGHAGSSAALAAARQLSISQDNSEIKITLIDQSDYLRIGRSK